LLNELRQRTDDLTESLEQQTATSDVLRVISSSPTDIQPVLETIGERAKKLCNAEISGVSIVDGELIHLASAHGMTQAGVEATRRAFPLRRSDETVTARAIRTCSVCHVADVLSDPQYQPKDAARIAGWRGCLGVPMVRDEQVVGAIFVCARRQPGLFSDAQVQLLKTFADQAAIAIENVRPFESEQQRTQELTESLEQQTATSKVLDVISRSGSMANCSGARSPTIHLRTSRNHSILRQFSKPWPKVRSG
jgi:GAF domain-containing protein